ncbi:MAG: hypothetical protein QMD05_08665 [Candidatus Brocadiaceae bacterium]|nr:hypothetical protein [Candidatus Brocadiaceae bacterium]
MTQREADYEAVIVQKLRAMEDLLKSFMSSLEELPRKMLRTQVRSRTYGQIRWWTDLLEVEDNERLCFIEGKAGASDENVYAPRAGRLLILAFVGEDVEVGQVIAEIEPKAWA